MSLQNVERLSGGLRLIALQPRNVTGFRVYLQTIFHVAHASHRQNSVDQLLNFVRQHRSGQDNPSVLSLNFYGRRMPDKKPKLRAHSADENFVTCLVVEQSRARFAEKAHASVPEIARRDRSAFLQSIR